MEWEEKETPLELELVRGQKVTSCRNSQVGIIRIASIYLWQRQEDIGESTSRSSSNRQRSESLLPAYLVTQQSLLNVWQNLTMLRRRHTLPFVNLAINQHVREL